MLLRLEVMGLYNRECDDLVEDIKTLGWDHEEWGKFSKNNGKGGKQYLQIYSCGCVSVEDWLNPTQNVERLSKGFIAEINGIRTKFKTHEELMAWLKTWKQDGE